MAPSLTCIQGNASCVAPNPVPSLLTLLCLNRAHVESSSFPFDFLIYLLFIDEIFLFYNSGVPCLWSLT